jgi:hypothetical protein
MAQTSIPTAPIQPQSATPVRRRPPAWLVVSFVGLASLLIGIGIGGSGQAAAPDATSPPPAATTTVSAACLDALDDAEELMAITSEFAGIAGDLPMMVYEAAQAGASFDTAAIEGLTDKLNTITADVEELTEQIGSSDYRDNAAQCRDAAG